MTRARARARTRLRFRAGTFPHVDAHVEIAIKLERDLIQSMDQRFVLTCFDAYTCFNVRMLEFS